MHAYWHIAVVPPASLPTEAFIDHAGHPLLPRLSRLLLSSLSALQLHMSPWILSLSAPQLHPCVVI